MISVFGENLSFYKLKTVNFIQLELFEQYKYDKLVSRTMNIAHGGIK